MVAPRNARFYQVPLGRYFFFVGSLLVAMLFVAEWYLPDSPQSFVREAYVDKSIIRIKSAHKWPERVVIDTSLPTIVPPSSAVLANTPLINPPREAFAQVDAPSQQVSRTASLPSSKPKVAKKATHTRMAAYRDPSQASMTEVLTSRGLTSGGLAGRLVMKNSLQREPSRTAHERQLEFAPMTGAELKQLRVDLGDAIGRTLSAADMAKLCGLASGDGADAIRRWEIAGPSGPAGELLRILAMASDRHPILEKFNVFDRFNIPENERPARRQEFREKMRDEVRRRLA